MTTDRDENVVKLAPHTGADHGVEVQCAVHAVAMDWIEQRGFCPDCVAQHVIMGACAVARAHEWTESDVHEIVAQVFSGQMPRGQSH
jgi:hypothetical protein